MEFLTSHWTPEVSAIVWGLALYECGKALAGITLGCAGLGCMFVVAWITGAPIKVTRK